ncbi:membrane metallo-endopeptidase-like 1 [Drosophila busckii]|uniref:membrane metallo-endopeptidase-like 1 n=1 Tax=Drosophila busckii TaxID=30019 RepID=UPI00083EEC34|nr:membrane metallo-endopeptidase-like 1 [Drosophila busckii]
MLKLCLLLCCAWHLALANVARPYASNYTTDILRLSKAAAMKAYLGDGEQRPCNNFYKFACGNWPRLHPAKLNSRKTNYLEELQELFVLKSAYMLQHATRSVDTSADRTLKSFYSTCLEQANNTREALKTLMEVTDFRGGWPEIRVPSWYNYEYDWLQLIAKLKRQLGVDILIGLDVVLDYKEENQHRLKLGAPQLPLGQRRHYLDAAHHDARERYEQRIVEKLTRYFPEQSAQWRSELAAQVLSIEQQLARGLPHNAALPMEQTTRTRTAAELKNAYGSYIDITRYLHYIYNDTLIIDIYETPEDYLYNLVDVIKSTPKLQLANYTMWRVLDTLDEARVPWTMQQGHWCVQLVRKYFPLQLESLFQRNYNNMQMVNELQSTWADIKRVFREDLQASTELHWLTLDTRQRAINKLESMDLQMRNHDDAELIRELHGLHLRRDQFYWNLVQVLQWRTERHLRKLLTEPKATDKLYKLPHYELSSNKIHIPITFMQARFFWDAAYPTALKYGTLGVLLARQMLHGFDDVGRRHDAHGYRNNMWDLSSETSYARRTQCFHEQYAVFVEHQHKPVRDKDLMRRIVADNGALNIAYRAYVKWLKNSAESASLYQRESLPILEHNHNQLFYLAYAQLYCSDYPEQLEVFEELPEQLRVNTALSNAQSFANAFDCSRGDKLNARFKCVVF